MLLKTGLHKGTVVNLYDSWYGPSIHCLAEQSTTQAVMAMPSFQKQIEQSRLNIRSIGTSSLGCLIQEAENLKPPFPRNSEPLCTACQLRTVPKSTDPTQMNFRWRRCLDNATRHIEDKVGLSLFDLEKM